jgi:tRNA dimethylallyltransferase
MSNKHCIIIAGPTASGKTAKAIQLAKELNTEIISADSRQCFKELKIGVARPSEQQLKEIPHHFIANHSIHESINAKSFAEEASSYLNNIFQNKEHAIICGGTGLYIKALIEGFDDIPTIPIDIRNKVIAIHEEGGLEYLREELLKLDPGFKNAGDINNPNRMMRALEVVMHTGKPIGSFQTKEKRRPPFTFSYQIIDIPRDVLYERINNRVDAMIEEGLEDEARSLIPYQEMNALQTVGYKELFDYFNGIYSKSTAIEKIKQHTRNYAKRQITWFKKI